MDSPRQLPPMPTRFQETSPLEHRFRGENPLRTLLFLYRGERRRLLAGTVFFVIKHSPVWMMPLLTANIIDIIAQPDRHALSELWINAGVLVGLLLQNVPMHFWYMRAVSRAVRTLETRLRSALCRRLQHLSIGYYASQSAGVLQSKVLRDVESIEQLTRLVFDSGLSALTNLGFALVITAVRAPWFLVFFLLTVPVATMVVYALRASLTASNTAFRREIEQMSSRVTEMTHLIPITRAHGLEASALERVDQSIERVRDAALEVDATNATFGALAWVTFNLFNMACLVFAALVYARHWLPITLGDVVMLTTYFALMTNSVLTLVSTAPQATKGLEAIRSIGEVLQCPDLELNEGKALVAAVRGEFTFEAVSYRYPGAEAAAIENFDLRVQPGETVALVGPSGAGKSTVLNLAIGFLRPTAGRILIDGQDMGGLDLRTYRRFVSVVPQESILFDGSIRENVTYGMKGVPDATVVAALQSANAWEFVSPLPEGIATTVGEKGARLSGGQKQRLAIARALIRDPRVLILDEATSALDTETERLIQEALERLMVGRTTLVVAHRLSTIRRAHRIIVLNHARVVEVGTHESLLESGGLYAQLHQQQAGAPAGAAGVAGAE